MTDSSSAPSQLQNSIPSDSGKGDIPKRYKRAVTIAALVLIASTWLLEAFELWRDRQERITSGVSHARNLSRVLAAHAEEYFDEIDRALISINQETYHDDLTTPEAVRNILRYLGFLHSTHPELIEIIITDERCNVLHSVGLATNRDIARDATPIFDDCASLPQSFTVSGPRIGQHGVILDKYYLPVSRPYFRRDGRVGGFIVGMTSTDAIISLYESVDLSEYTAVGIIHSAGKVMMLNPTDPRVRDRDFRGTTFFESITQGPSDGVEVSPNGLLYRAYAKALNGTLTPFVTVDENKVLAGWNEEATAVALELGLLTLLIIALASLLERTLRRTALEQANSMHILERSMIEARSARAQVAEVIEATPDAVAIVNLQWRITFANRELCQLLKQAPDVIIGSDLWNTLPYLDRSKLEYCQQTRTAVQFEVFTEHVDPTGTVRIFEVRAFTTANDIVIYQRDVTEQRATDRKLLEASRMQAVGQLAGGLAHDLNNMLSVILGHAEMLIERVSKPNNAKSAERIRMAATYSAAILNRLLAFARQEQAHPRRLDIRSEVGLVLELLHESLPEKIAIENEVDGLWYVNADPSQFGTALINLILNARDALSEGGRISITARSCTASEMPSTTLTSGEFVAVCVADNGCGMNPEVLRQAFEPFFSTKRSKKGSGLGLSMVYNFAHGSGGTVGIESALGQGSKITIYLPRAIEELSQTQAEAKIISATSPQGSLVLLVEDNDLVREATLEQLTEIGYRVTVCSSAEEALAIIDGGCRPDILLTDIVLAGELNGRQLAVKLTAQCPKTFVLLMTGYDATRLPPGAEEYPDWPVLWKPFSRDKLAEALAGLSLRTEASPHDMNA